MSILLKSGRFSQCYYKKAGTGFPVVLLHGFGESSDIFKYQLSFLQQFYTIILPDIPGSGESALPAETMSMELIADFVNEVIMQEKLSSVILLGHSMGGYAALAFAEKYRENIKAFGLLHSTALPDSEEKKENRRKSIKLIRNEGKDIFLKAMIPNLYSDRSKELIPGEISFHLTLARAITSDSLIAYCDAMMERKDKTDVIKNSEVPVLFVIGKEDNLLPYTEILTQSAMPVISALELFEDIGHTSMLECPQKVNDVLNNFCRGVLQNKIA